LIRIRDNGLQPVRELQRRMSGARLFAMLAAAVAFAGNFFWGCAR